MDINYDKNFFKKNEDNPSIESNNNKFKNSPYMTKINQLILYFNFRLYLKNALSSTEKEEKTFYLIDKKWIQEWKKNIGYDKIKECYDNFQLNRDLNNKDYNWIESIIKNNINNELLPLDNFRIYNNNEIDPLADFIMVNENCYKSFIFENIKTMNVLNGKGFQTIILKEKIILIINQKIYLLIFKENETENYFELIIVLKEENPNKKEVINFLEKKDINEWIKEINIDLKSKTGIPTYINNYKIQITNKTLMSYQKGNMTKTMKRIFTKEEQNQIGNLNIKGNISDNTMKELELEMTKNFEQMNSNQNIQVISNNNNINDVAGTDVNNKNISNNNDINNMNNSNINININNINNDDNAKFFNSTPFVNTISNINENNEQSAFNSQSDIQNQSFNLNSTSSKVNPFELELSFLYILSISSL